MVRSLNGLTDGVTLAAGANVTLTPAGNVLTLAVPNATPGWGLTGNAGTAPGTHFLGTTDAQPLVLRSNGAEVMRLAVGGNVGIGTSNPAARLDVAGAINATTQYNLGGARILGNAGTDNLFAGVGAGAATTGSLNAFFGRDAGLANTTGGENAFFGRSAGIANTEGLSNAFFGAFAGADNVTGSHNTIIGNSADVSTNNLSNATALGFRALVGCSNCLVLGSINGVNGSTASTNVGIGTTTPAFRLHLGVDSAAKPATNTWTVASDARLKDDIQPFTDGLAALKLIHPVTYRYNGKGGLPKGLPGIGVVAQEVRAVLPYSVTTFAARLEAADGAETELLGFNSHALTYLLINAVKELAANVEALRSGKGAGADEAARRIAALEAGVAAQQRQNAALEARLAALEQQLQRAARGH